MTTQKFKYLIKKYGGQYEKDDKRHNAWWDAYGGIESIRNMCVCFGRLMELNKDEGDLFLIGNWIHWTPAPKTALNL